MNVPLRWKIQLLAVLVPLGLGLGALWIVNQRVTERVRSDLHDQLITASLVLESHQAARAAALDDAAQVVARDPRFFAALALPADAADPHFRATVRGVARDFARVARVDRIEAYDRRGRVLAVVGGSGAPGRGRAPLVRAALHGRGISAVVAEGGAQYLVALRPVRADRRLVGAVLLGRRMDGALARELRTLTRSEVSFVSGAGIFATTLRSGADRRALTRALAEGLGPETRLPSGTCLVLARDLPGAPPGSGQRYVLQRPLAGELAFLRALQASLARIGLLVVLAALFVALVLAREISQPIRRLVRVAEEMERGNYEYPLEVARRDEIGYLAERFAQMRRHERDYVTSLEDVAHLKSQFIGIASHELRTPVTVIKSYSELIADGALGPVTPDQTKALATIEASLGQIVRITEDATSMAQLESERPLLALESCDVAEIVAQAVRAALVEAPQRSVQVTQEIAPGLGRARLDAPRLTQAIANLVRNAIRFTPDGGSACVRARRQEGELVFVVEDTGVGIAEADVARLLSHALAVRDPRHHHSSRTLEFNSAGIGLGLPIAVGIVKAHGGSVTVESAPGRGTAFIVRVPAEFEASPVAESSPPVVPASKS